MRNIGAAALGLTIACAEAAGQSINPDSTCTAADQAVERAALPSTSDTAWFRWYTLASCGQKGARAAAAALRTNELRNEADEARLSVFFSIFGGVRSKLLLDSFQDAAEDNGASAVVRLWSIEAMTGYLSPTVGFARAALASGSPSARCALTPHGAASGGGFDDLPNDVFGRVLNSVTRVANKAAATPTVQRLATCWQQQLELRAPVSLGQIQLSYVCGTKFKVSNGNTAVVKVQYVVLQSQGAGELTLLGKEDLTFGVAYPGTVQLSYNGQVFATKANTNKVCP